MPERRVWIAQCLCGPNRHCIAEGTVTQDRFNAAIAPCVHDAKEGK